MTISGVKTKREAVKLGLTTLLRLGRHKEIKAYRGKSLGKAISRP